MLEPKIVDVVSVPFSSDEDGPTEPLSRCPMCHQQVPERHIVFLGGRQVCFCCASAWFAEDDPA
jgi:formylmethanofuran dehydrogenase subunit E